ncbi:D-alanyl-D-alanine carboxypeptidase [Streptomyces bohaiensis]|uniref:D-alanyl-D-alanine carboxypeptidase family protein n=1 Tax=Streptomyces bohaiensis TaxID=1431344 RepID=UPI003B7EF08E
MLRRPSQKRSGAEAERTTVLRRPTGVNGSGDGARGERVDEEAPADRGTLRLRAGGGLLSREDDPSEAEADTGTSARADADADADGNADADADTGAERAEKPVAARTTDADADAAIGGTPGRGAAAAGAGLTLEKKRTPAATAGEAEAAAGAEGTEGAEEAGAASPAEPEAAGDGVDPEESAPASEDGAVIAEVEEDTEPAPAAQPTPDPGPPASDRTGVPVTLAKAGDAPQEEGGAAGETEPGAAGGDAPADPLRGADTATADEDGDGGGDNHATRVVPAARTAAESEEAEAAGTSDRPRTAKRAEPETDDPAESGGRGAGEDDDEDDDEGEHEAEARDGGTGATPAESGDTRRASRFVPLRDAADDGSAVTAVSTAVVPAVTAGDGDAASPPQWAKKRTREPAALATAPATPAGTGERIDGHARTLFVPKPPAADDPRDRDPDAAPAPEGPPPPIPDSLRDPMELLAELTNRQAPAPSLLRSTLRRVKIWTPLVLLLVVLLAVGQLLRPLPEPELVATTAQTHTFAGELPAVPWPDTGQAALDVDGVGTFGTAGDQEPVPIASVTKTMTAYVILRDHPMEPDGDGAEIPVDPKAEEDAGLGESRGDSVVEIQAGDVLTQREALQALMIASANNVAWLLARWDSGDTSSFVRKMNAAAAELGMEDTVYTDPAGYDLGSVSTAADQVKLGRAVMQDPVMRQIVGVSSYVDQYGETHPNGNSLVPVNGVVGIKTGSRTQTGGNFLFAARQEVDGENVLIVGAVLSQPPHPSDNSIRTGAITAGDALMRFAQDQLTTEPVLAAGETVGHVDDGLGGRTPVVTSEDVTAVGWPGLAVRVGLSEEPAGRAASDAAADEEAASEEEEIPGHYAALDGLPSQAESGTEVGSLTVGDRDSAVAVPVELGAAMAEPGFLARLFRLG